MSDSSSSSSTEGITSALQDAEMTSVSETSPIRPLSSSIDNLQPIALLIDELRSEEVERRIGAMRRLSTIAVALGAERTRVELIPFLQSSIDEEDEVLLVMAEELGKAFVDYVGGPKWAHLILLPLEGLTCAEETVVREQAVKSLLSILDVLSREQVGEYFLPIVFRLSESDWFTKKTSAAALYSDTYQLVAPAQQEELCRRFILLCNDDTPMVRRAASMAMAKLIKVMAPEDVKKELVPVYLGGFVKDDQDSVRLLAVDILLSFAAVFSEEEKRSLLVPTFNVLSQDKSWRVRYMLASRYEAICRALPDGPDGASDALGVFCGMLKDFEAEVRTAAATQLPGVCTLFGQPAFQASILPVIQTLVVDPSPHVRSAFALQINDLSSVAGRDLTLTHLLPIFLQLFRDAVPEVRLNVISKLDVINHVIGIEHLAQSLLPAIVQLAEDRQWHVRQAIIEYIPVLARHLGQAFFDEQLLSLSVGWLQDPVFAVRETAIVNLKQLVEIFGPQWAATPNVLGRVVELCTNSNYLRRQTALFAFAALSSTLPPQLLCDLFLPALRALAADAIANVRFGVAKTIEAMLPALLVDQMTAVKELCLPTLQQLQRDADEDVQFYAQRAMLLIPTIL